MKHVNGFLLLPIIVMVLTVQNLYGQLSGNNLMEYQLGNIPQVNPRDYAALYDQFNLQYRYNQFTGKIRLEHFMTPEAGRDYTKLTQYNLSHHSGNFGFEAGHFYETFGRGVLLRSYDIKGSVYEGRARRIKHGFYKNMNGFAARFISDKLRVKAVRGRMLSGQFPPGFDYSQRWANLVEGIASIYTFAKQNFGLTYIRNHLADSKNHFGAININGSLPVNISYYTEWAHAINKAEAFFHTKTDSRYAFYFNLNYNYNNLGVLIEYKDYQDFLIGTGVNEPPALVKEHGYKLLNRSTHIPQLIDESGFQTEWYYFFPNFHTLTWNVTRLENELHKTFTFEEYFLEWSFPVMENHDIKTFVDYGKEGIELIQDRLTTGMNWNYSFGNQWSTQSELEYQQFDRGKQSVVHVHNYLAAFSATKSGQFSVGILWEWSDDPNLADDPKTLYIEKGITHWPGINFTYWYKNHTMQLFAGKRRGGPACTSGICYEVLDFRGVELRLISNL